MYLYKGGIKLSAKRLSRTITNPKDLEFLIDIDEDKATRLSFISECFGTFNGKRRFNPYDFITVPAGKYGPEGKKNKEPFVTTAGIWIFNKAFIEVDLFDLFGYINKTVTKKVFKKINKKISYAVIEDDLSLDKLKRYLLKTQKFQPYCNILSPSINEAMLTIGAKIDAKRKELFKKYNKELKEESDPVISQKVENELLDYAAEILKDDPSMDFIDSGAKPSWGNNFKNMFVMRGAVKQSDPYNGDFKVLEGNYMDGMPQDEFASFADIAVGGSYARAKKTASGGYWEKAAVRGFQHLIALPEGTDCGTKRTKTVTLTEDNVDIWMYSYMVENGKYVELTSKNKDKYIGKTVQFRFSLYCEDKKGICNICAGNLFNRIGIKNVGVASYAIFSAVKNFSMKSFHDSTIKTSKMADYGYGKIFGMND